MKKLLSVFLTICLLASLAVCFTVSANAEIDVIAGMKFEWNDQSTNSAAAVKWRTGGGKSSDGLWKYEVYSLKKQTYYPVYLTSGAQYAWSANAGSDDNGMGYARVRELGKKFHPAYAADIVKTFICPAGGTIDIVSTVARTEAVPGGSEANGTSFAIYVEDRRVYPAEGQGEYVTITDTAEKTYTVTSVEVAKNESVHIHIGALENQEKDEVIMSNTITYKSVDSDKVADVNTDTADTNTDTDEGSAGENWWDDIDNGKDNNNKNNNNDKNNGSDNDGGLSTGAIVGIVIGAVAVVGIAAAAVVIVMKKKKQD